MISRSRLLVVIISAALAAGAIPIAGWPAVAAPEPTVKSEQDAAEEESAETPEGLEIVQDGRGESGLSPVPGGPSNGNEPQDENVDSDGEGAGKPEVGNEDIGEGDFPLGGPLSAGVSALPSRAVTAASYPSRREYLMPVLAGHELGSNGRYGDGTSYVSNSATIRCSSSAAEGTNIRITSACTSGKLTTTVLSPSARTVVSTKTISLSGTLPTVGGVEKMSDGYIYLLTGRDNTAESNSNVVYRVSKYNASLALVGSASITAGEVWWGVQYPFRAGSPSMAMVGDTLYAHLARTLYKGADGLNHQVNLTLSLDAVSMGAMQAHDYSYSSHSFNQFARSYEDESKLFVADHGDAYPRSIFGANLRVPDSYMRSTGAVLELVGRVGDNSTFATLNGVEILGGTAGFVGTSAPQKQPIQGITGTPANKAGQVASNLYFGGFDLEDTEYWTTPTFRWLTNNNPVTSNTLVGEPTLTALPSGNFVVLYQMTTPRTWDRKLHYLLISPTGSQLASRSFSGLAYLPSSQPVLLGDSLYWVGAAQQKTEYLGDYGATQVLMGMNLANELSPTMHLVPPPNKPSVSRLSGPSRYDTNAAVNAKFGVKGGPMFVATGADFADALSIGPVVGITGGTLFLVPRNSVDRKTLNAMAGLSPSAVYAVGGTGAVSASVAEKVRSATGKAPVRVSGKNRYDTSEQIFKRFFVDDDRPVSSAFVATGRDFPDALSAASAGAALQVPVLLVDGILGTGLSSYLTSSLKEKGATRVLISGGKGAVNNSIESNLRTMFTVERLSGPNRYATNAAVNAFVAGRAGGTPLTSVWVATGADFPDALSAAAPSGKLSSRLVLSNGSCIPKPVVSEQLTKPGSKVGNVYLVGGKGVLAQSVYNLAECR